ncbi:MAG TPA: hypothetical protein VIZ00_01315 [Streptosporangiaceae bacterium]
MTENIAAAAGPPPWPEPPAPEPRHEQQGTAGLVKDQAADLGHSGAAAGQHAAGVAREQAAEVAAEAGRQGRDLLRDAQGQLTQQAASAQGRLAAGLRALGAELTSMADRGDQPGPAGSVAREAASRVRAAGPWLDAREPADVLDDVRAFARRRPGAFLAAALAAGLAAGRLTRGLAAAHGDDGDGGTDGRVAPAAGRSSVPGLPESTPDVPAAFPAGAGGTPDHDALRQPGAQLPGDGGAW